MNSTTNQILVPTVIEKTHQGERAYDIYSRLLNERIIFVGTHIDDAVANTVIAQLLHLQHEDPTKDIYLYINSPGGSVTSGMAVYDTMNYIKPDVQTIAIGMAASMGAVLLAGGAKDKRFALPNSKIMIHQPHSAYEGTAVDIEIHAREILRTKKRLEEIMSKATGKTLPKVKKDMDRDFWMTSQEAEKYGIIDGVIETDPTPSVKSRTRKKK